MTHNDISFKIRGAAFKVHNALGPGLLESVYEAALIYELRKLLLEVKNQVAIPMMYDNVKMEVGFRLDILVQNEVIIEIKSVESIQEVHFKQVLTYLKLTDKRLGLLINFNSTSLIDGVSIIRIVNKL